MTTHSLVLKALEKRYPDWRISISGARRKRGKKRVYIVSWMQMIPKRGGLLGGYVESWTITI